MQYIHSFSIAYNDLTGFGQMSVFNSVFSEKITW